jgi:hypothetical protein
MNLFRLAPESQEEIREEPVRTPKIRMKSRRFIRRSLYLWQVAQSRDAPRVRWQDTHHPISSEPTLRIFFIAPTFPWQFSQSTPALTCRLWEK